MALPVSLDEAKAQLRVDGDEQDDEILGFISDAADWVERRTGQILEAREVTEQVRAGRVLTLRAWPVAAAAVPEVSYAGSDGLPITVSGARLDITRRPARVLPATGTSWPFRNSDLCTVSVRAGYEDPAAVPRVLRRAMLLLIGAYDADREGGSTLADAETAAGRLCEKLKRHTL
nr:phage head-tail connector protein [Novosphingobium panipatense]